MSKVRNYCFTLNNYTEEQFQMLLASDVKYIILGREVAPTTLTPHIQGFVILFNPMNLVGAKRRLGVPEIHMEQCHGTPQQNVEYCSKGGNFEERGDRPKGQGTRTDLVGVYNQIKEGARLDELVHTHFTEVVKFHRGITLAVDLLRGKKRETMTIGYWAYGATGTGKSRWAFSHPLPTYSKDPNHKWFDGYEYEDVVVIDDYRPSKEFPFNFLLRLCDRYPMKVETKGGMREFNSKVIIITSPVNIDQAFAHLDFLNEGSIAQLKRRFREVDFNLENIVENMVLYDLI